MPLLTLLSFHDELVAGNAERQRDVTNTNNIHHVSMRIHNATSVLQDEDHVGVVVSGQRLCVERRR